jgi:peptide/nickel transport system substrate-binding protein/microcin C transport system substrate-binding protein
MLAALLLPLLCALGAGPALAAVAAAPARPASGAAAGPWVHAHAAYGAPKYGAAFAHFEYVDPQAPKGGTLYLRNPDRRSSFDKFNNFMTKGSAPAGLVVYMLETLAIVSGDEPQTMYGLLAQEMSIATDKSSITFRLNPKARFYNGDPVTAADVKYSYDAISGKFASPAVQAGYNNAIERAVVLDERTIRFDLKDKSNDALFIAGGVPVFSPKWALGPDGKPKQFDQIVTEYPITSGPYTIASADGGRRIEFKRNPEYWARDLPVRRGFFNFDRVVYRYYADNDVAREAFKAGEFDIFREYSARSWVRLHKGPKWDDGRIVKDPMPTGFGQALQSYQLNLRRPKLQDIRVREAIGLTYDFEMTINRYGQYQRADSMFNNTDFAATGLPSPAELALLEPFRKDLPKEVFGPPYKAPRTNGDPMQLRKNLLKARALFEAAGWKLDAGGRLRNAAGETFVLEYMRPGEGSNNLPEWQKNMEKLGATLKFRDVDFALFQQRLDEYDFDTVAIVEGQFTLPTVSSLLNSYGSKSADEKGNGNFRGVKSPAVDHILKAMAAATSIDELRTATRALDRVVMWNHWQVPDLYLSNLRASYWNKFGIPKVRPLYYTIESALDEQPAWPITTWWIKPASAAKP